MYAVLLDRNKQYKVKPGNLIKIEKINMNIGEKIIFTNIILFSNNQNIYIGKPKLKNISVEALVYSHKKEKKIRIIKFTRRKHYKKTQGHRQLYTNILIKKILYNKTGDLNNGS